MSISSTTASGAGVTIFPGDGTGLLDEPSWRSMYGMRDVDVADLDGDGSADVVAARDGIGGSHDPAQHEITVFMTRLD